MSGLFSQRSYRHVPYACNRLWEYGVSAAYSLEPVKGIYVSFIGRYFDGGAFSLPDGVY